MGCDGCGGMGWGGMEWDGMGRDGRDGVGWVWGEVHLHAETAEHHVTSRHRSVGYAGLHCGDLELYDADA